MVFFKKKAFPPPPFTLNRCHFRSIAIKIRRFTASQGEGAGGGDQGVRGGHPDAVAHGASIKVHCPQGGASVGRDCERCLKAHLAGKQKIKIV